MKIQFWKIFTYSMEGMKLGKHDAPRKPEIIPFLKSSQQKCQQISDRIYGFVPLV